MMRLFLLALLGLSPGLQAPPDPTRDAGSFIREDLHLARYKSAAVDLDGDGIPEVLVYADAPQDCGSGGCDLYILARRHAGYRRVTTVSVARLPIRMLATASNGWRDLGVQVAGGGIARGYEARLRFDGKTYPGNPTVPPAVPLARMTGDVVLK